MSGPFSAIGTAGSALRTYRTWLDAVSNNIANLNTATRTTEEAYRPQFVVAQAIDGDPRSGKAGGVRVAGLELGSAEGRLVFQPDHPLADEDGMVRMPDTDLGDQMVQMMVAQRGYQANLAVVDRARDSYLAALQIGRG
jgi:flagellar basal-body rod protein FlgC